MKFLRVAQLVSLLCAFTVLAAAQNTGVSDRLQRAGGIIQILPGGGIIFRPRLGQSMTLFDSCTGAPVSGATQAAWCYDSLSATVRISVNGGPYLNWTNPGAGAGTVSSISVAVPSFMSVTPGTIASAGTFTFSFNAAAANTVFAGPSSGVAAGPGLRILVADDIPFLNTSKLNGGVIPIARGGTGFGSYTQGAMLYANSSSTLAQIMPNVATSRLYLMSTGDGVTPNAQVFTQPLFTDLGGIAQTGQGGTGLVSIGAANQVLGVTGVGTGLEYKTITGGTNVTIGHTANAVTINASNADTLNTQSASSYFSEFIQGLELVYVGLQAIDVKLGRAWIPGTGKVLVSNSTISKTAIVSAANTWYYVYFYDNAGTPDVEISTTVPILYGVNASQKTGDNTRRFIGAYLTHFTNANTIYRFITRTNGSEFDLTWLVVHSGASFRAYGNATVPINTITTFSVAPNVPANVYSKYKFQAIFQPAAGVAFGVSIGGVIVDSTGFPGEWAVEFDNAAAGLRTLVATGMITLDSTNVQFLCLFGPSGLYIDTVGFVARR